MEDKDTPIKVHSRLDISPSSKNRICVHRVLLWRYAMEDKDTPIKVHSRLDISPSSKNRICVQCCRSEVKADIRRKLFGPSFKKTKACLSLELLLGEELDRNLLLTDIICRNCFDRNETLVKKIAQFRENFESSKAKLASESAVFYTKRMSKDISYEEICENAEKEYLEPAARKSLFETESDVTKPIRAKTLKTWSSSTETVSASMTEDESESLSSVEVRNIHLMFSTLYVQDAYQSKRPQVKPSSLKVCLWSPMN